MELQNNSTGNSITETFISELKKWNESKKVVTSCTAKGDNVVVMFGKYEFTFTCPTSEDESYIVQSNRPYNWLDDVNIYCLERKPTLSRLLNVMSKQISKIKDELDTVVKLGDTVNIDRNLGFDIEKYTKIKSLEALAPTSKSVIEYHQKRGQLFGQAVVAKIIISEFIKLWDQSRNNSKYPFKIDIVDDNIYRWKLKFNNFTNRDLEESLSELETKFGYNYIEVDIYFHDTLYPNYPPVVKILRPRLLNSLMHKIANTKMIQLEYWIPARTMSFIVNKIYYLLDKHAKILIDTELNNKTKFSDGSFLPIETHLLDLASFVDIGNSDDVDDEKYDKIFDQKTTTEQKKKSNTVWKSGTGYGHCGTAQWDVASYVKSCEERDRQVQSILNKIILEIQESNDLKVIYNTIQYSILIKYIKSLLSDTTLLEIRKHISLYQIVFILLGNLVNEDAIFLFDKLPDSKTEDKPLYEILRELNSMCLSAQKFYKTDVKTEENEDELTCIIMNLYSMISPCYENYIEQNKIKQQIKKAEEIKQKSEEDIYIKTMTEFRDSDDDFKIVNTNYHYQGEFENSKSTKLYGVILKRINDEILTFRSLPISYDAMIIARHDVNYQTVIRTLITGPTGTPYEGGCFLFDTYLHSNFPSSAPHVWFLNTGGQRMNPNLYNNGKVCLSILGTWNGDRGGESWNPKISTLIQVYKSIQCQILIEEPFFNEPGYESSYNTANGMQQSKQYNDNIRLYTMKHAMYDLIDNPKLYPQFEDVIRAHFKLKMNKILYTCDKWTNEASSTLKSSYETVNMQIKYAIGKL